MSQNIVGICNKLLFAQAALNKRLEKLENGHNTPESDFSLPVHNGIKVREDLQDALDDAIQRIDFLENSNRDLKQSITSVGSSSENKDTAQTLKDLIKKTDKLELFVKERDSENKHVLASSQEEFGAIDDKVMNLELDLEKRYKHFDKALKDNEELCRNSVTENDESKRKIDELYNKIDGFEQLRQRLHSYDEQRTQLDEQNTQLDEQKSTIDGLIKKFKSDESSNQSSPIEPKTLSTRVESIESDEIMKPVSIKSNKGIAVLDVSLDVNGSNDDSQENQDLGAQKKGKRREMKKKW